MARGRIEIVAMAFALGLVSAPANAQSSGDASDETVRFTLGLKLWYNNWETWDHPFEAERSDTKLTWIPVLGVNYGRYFGSFSYFNKTRYNFPVSIGNVDRREMDLSAGYWVLQGEGGRIGLSAGYKEVRQKFSGGVDSTITAPFIGLTGAAHITGPWSIYMGGAYGPAKETFQGFKATGYYMSTEAGVAYSLGRSTVITGGYKTQVIDVGGDCSTFSGVVTSSARCRDTTDGFIVGVSHTF